MKTITKLKLLTHGGALLPLLWLFWDYFNHQLTVNPIQAAMQRTGKTAIVLLMLTLACTPIYILFKYKPVLGLRRMLGLYTFFYASLHLTIYVGLDYGFNWESIFQNLYEKQYIYIGFAAFLILAILAITSFRWWMKKLGKNWKRLHRLVYLAGILVVLHYAWVKKGDLFALQGDIIGPLLFGILLIALLIVRLPVLRQSHR